MVIQEKKMDLFSVGDEYFLAHCISADIAMGAGIATQFNRHFNMKNKLKDLYPHGICDYYGWLNTDILVDRVFNLVTKERYWHKPTLQTLEKSLRDMKKQILDICPADKTIKLAIPLIGCDIDRLLWSQVKPLIVSVFEDVDIEILVCYIKEELLRR